MNPIVENLVSRKSVRAFEDKPIPEDIKKEILLAAFHAPTAGNQQLYTILDITDQSLKDRLSVSCDHQPFIARAPMVLIFCADVQKWYDIFVDSNCNPREPGKGDLMLAVEDAAIAAQNSVTAAWGLGVGSCYIGDIMEHREEQQKLLHLPRYVFPAVMLVFGYPTRQQSERQKPRRFHFSYIVHQNGYHRMEGSRLRQMLQNRIGSLSYEAWCRAFYLRKYHTGFSEDMNRSVREYLENFKHGGSSDAGKTG